MTSCRTIEERVEVPAIMPLALDTVVKLKTPSGETLSTTYRAVRCSRLIKRLLTLHRNDSSAIPIDQVSTRILERILVWCERHKEDENFEADVPLSRVCGTEYLNIHPWDDNFFSVDYRTLFMIIQGANYLDIPQLLDSGCKMVASLMRGKTPSELRSMFNIRCDFTPEEERMVRRENEWISDFGPSAENFERSHTTDSPDKDLGCLCESGPFHGDDEHVYDHSL